MKIVFHGHNARSFRAGIEKRLPPGLSLVDVPDVLTDPADRAHYASADVVVGVRLDASMPRPDRARLFHAPAAGTDGIDMRCLPPACTVCNCFGHEYAIAEYVLSLIHI